MHLVGTNYDCSIHIGYSKQETVTSKQLRVHYATKGHTITQLQIIIHSTIQSFKLGINLDSNPGSTFSRRKTSTWIYPMRIGTN